MSEVLTFLGGESRPISDLAQLPRPLVFTNGVFDILHCGHVEYLRNAR